MAKMKEMRGWDEMLRWDVGWDGGMVKIREMRWWDGIDKRDEMVAWYRWKRWKGGGWLKIKEMRGLNCKDEYKMRGWDEMVGW